MGLTLNIAYRNSPSRNLENLEAVLNEYVFARIYTKGYQKVPRKKLSEFMLTNVRWLICRESSVKNYKRMKIIKSVLILNITSIFVRFCNYWGNVFICKKRKRNFSKKDVFLFLL